MKSETLWKGFIITMLTGIIIRVQFIDPINTAVSVVVSPKYSAATSRLALLLPLIFVIILMIDMILSIDDHRK